MSNAEEAALKAYPKETRDVSGFVIDIGHPQYMRDLYIEGYNQAEKDLELGWEDISIIRQIMFDYNRKIRNGMAIPNDEEYCKEVLKRFKDFKERRITMIENNF